MTETTPEYLTVYAAARRAGVGVRQLQRARDRGQLPVYRVGGWQRVRWADVLAFVERHPVTRNRGQHGGDLRAPGGESAE
jgi:excisionase family DNA binding protein